MEQYFLTETVSYFAERRLLLLIVASFFVLLGIDPKADRMTWFLENLPVLLGFVLLVVTDRFLRFSRLTYRLMTGHALILMVGGHWSYAEVPLGFWIQDALGLARNHYDRLGHFAQGFVPAIITREVLLRKTPLERGGWLFFLVCSVCLALSAFYEFIEWWVALLAGQASEAFLGTQGDIWDTQWDMAMALSGSILAQLSLAKVHDENLHEDEHPRVPKPDTKCRSS